MTNDPLSQSLADLIEHGQDVELPPPTEAEPMVSTSIRLPVSLLQWAKDEALARGLPSWSALVRELLEQEQRSPADDDAVISLGDLRQAIEHLAARRSPAA